MENGVYLTPIGKPSAVSFQAVNSTAVRVSWSGSSHLSTSLHLTTHCSSTHTIMAQYESVYPPGVVSALVDLDDDITPTESYVHNFTLHYIIGDDVMLPPGPPITVPFTFGTCNPMFEKCSLSCHVNFHR